MDGKSNCLFQSGNRIETSGLYELIGTGQETIIWELQAGERFPYFDGWEVCWCFKSRETGRDDARAGHNTSNPRGVTPSEILS